MSSRNQKALFLLKPDNGDWKVLERDIQKPARDEILVKIHATALNPIDWRIRAFNIQRPPFPTEAEYPYILGFDSAGTVEEVGEDVTGFVKGDRV